MEPTTEKLPYNKRFNTVLVYAGQAAPGGGDNERMTAWRQAADADGLTLGRWLAMLADKAAQEATR